MICHCCINRPEIEESAWILIEKLGFKILIYIALAGTFIKINSII